MKRVVVGLGVVAVLAVGGAVVAPGFVDWTKYKPAILSRVHDATGYNVSIDGPMELAILPFPHMAIGNLRVSVPAGESEAPLAQLDKVTVQLALAPLFHGDVVFTKISLLKPVFQIAIGADGTPSWMTPELAAMTGKKKDAAGGESFAHTMALNAVEVKDAVFSFSDRRPGGQTLTLDKINIALQGDSLYGPFSAEGDFQRDGVTFKTHVKSGRLDNLAESIALQFDLSLPDLGASVSYAGVAAFKDRPEFQGETGIDVRDPVALMAALDKKSALPSWLKKPFFAKGILTVDGDEIAYRNLRAGFGGMEGGGAIVLRNYAKDAKELPDVNIAFETDKPYDLKSLLPPSAKKDGAKGGGLLPETVTLPRDVTGVIALKSPAMQYGTIAFSEVAFNAERTAKAASVQLSLKGPGQTVLDTNAALAFGARSKSEKDGSVTFSDLAATVDVKAQSGEPLTILQAFSKTPPAKPLANLLANSFSGEGQIRLTPGEAAFKKAFVQFGQTRLDGEGAYKPGKDGGRGLLSVAAASAGIDADQWMQKIVGMPASAVVSQEKPDFAAMAKAVALPFDADVTISVGGLRFKGRDYTKMAVKGKLTGSRLSLDTLQLASNAGDVFTLSGGVEDVSALRGLDLSVQADVVDTEQTLKSFGADTARLPPGVGKSQVLASFKGQPEALGFTVNLKALRADVQASGTLGTVLTTPVVSDLTLRLQHPNYVELARLFSPTFNSGAGIRKNLDVFASLNRKGDVYTFSQLQATVGPTTVKGDVVADVSGAKPAVTAALAFTDLPVDELLGVKTEKGTTAKPMNSGVQDVRWSRNAINVSALQLVNVSLKATARSLTYGPWALGDAAADVALKDGVLTINQFDGGLYGGHMAVSGVLKSSDKERQPISFESKVLAQDVNLEEFVRSFSGARLVKASGAVSLETELRTAGLSPAALVFDLGGKGTMTGKNLVFEGFDLARLSRALAEPTSSLTENFGRLLDATMQGGTTSFDKLDGAFTITEGVVNFDKMNLTGEAADVATVGTVNLPLWTLDLVSTVQLKEPEDSPPLQATFKGPIDRPGQTFGQSAMKQYFMNQIKGTLITPNNDKIGKTLDKIDGSGALKTLLGVPTAAPKQPVAVQQAVPADASAPEEAAAQEAPAAGGEEPAAALPEEAPAQEDSSQVQEMRPEDAFIGILQNVIQKSQ